MKQIFLLALLPAVAGAVPVTGASLSFDALKSGEQVLNYYAGGFGAQGTGPGPAFGISFTSGLAADSTMIAFGPSALVTAPSVTMNLDTPWSDNVSFYFTGQAPSPFTAVRMPADPSCNHTRSTIRRSFRSDSDLVLSSRPYSRPRRTRSCA